MAWNEDEGGPEKLFSRLEKMLERVTTPMPMMGVAGDGALYDAVNDIASSLRFRVEQHEHSAWARAFELATQLRAEVARTISIEAEVS